MAVYDNPNKTLTQSTLNPNQVHQAKQFFKAWNDVAYSRGEEGNMIDLSNAELMSQTFNEYSELKQKAVTGAGASTGLGLVSSTFEPLTEILSVQGGGFIKSGIQFKDNQIGSAVFPAAANAGHYKDGASGSTVNNDVTSGNPFFNNSAVLAPKTLEIPIYDNPVLVNYQPGPAQLLTVWESYIANEKLVLADTLMANSIVSTTGVTALATSGAPYAPIASSIMKMISKVAKYGRPVVYVNEDGYFKLIDERNSNGDGVKYPLTINLFGQTVVNGQVTGEIPRVGKIGSLNGMADLVLIPTDATDSTNQTGIRSTYNTNGSNVITVSSGVPTTGGTKTAAIVGIPRFAGVGKAGNQFDVISVFNAQNSYYSFSTGQLVIGSRVHMGAVTINPVAWQYYAF